MRVLRDYEKFSSGSEYMEFREGRENESSEHFNDGIDSDLEDVANLEKMLLSIGVTHFRLYGEEEPMPSHEEERIVKHIMRGNCVVGTLYTEEDLKQLGINKNSGRSDSSGLEE